MAAGPAAIDLQSACSFAVLAGTSIGNSGPTTIHGDLGSPSQSGFASVTLVGTNHFNDSTTMAAQNDLLAAYGDGAGRVVTSTLATELGGTTQGPGVYHAASGTFTLTGILSLDGGGDSNAVFIFKTDSALNTAASSSVNLVNGAQAKNVFWVVGSSATLGASCLFKGTILANTAIVLGASCVISGRILARSAGITLDSESIVKPIYCGPPPSVSPPETLQLRFNHNAFDPRRESLLLSGVSSAGRIELEVYDLAGHLVRRLLSEDRGAGTWSVPWDGRDDGGQWAGSDVYVVLLRMGGVQKLQKVALLRD